MKSGFLPLSQESCIIGEVSYHDYFGILIDPEERELIARNLGPVNKVFHPFPFSLSRSLASSLPCYFYQLLL